MKKALIFGCNGFVGPYLANEFIKNGYDVIGSDIGDTSFRNDIKYFKCDIKKFDEVDFVIQTVNPTVIVNLAAVSSVFLSWKIPDLTMSINVNGSKNILESAIKLKVKPNILFVGSSEQYVASDQPINENTTIDSVSPYGLSKIEQEKLAAYYRDHYKIKVFCVRAFNHIGVGQRDSFVLSSFCKQVADIEKSKSSGTLKVGNLDVSRDFTDVRDVVRAYRLVVESEDDNIIYNIGSGRAYLIRDLLNYIISLTKQKITVEVDQTKLRPVDHPIICCDNSLIKKKLGWFPEHNLNDTLKEMFDAYIKSK